jgi:hypothetical protein
VVKLKQHRAHHKGSRRAPYTPFLSTLPATNKPTSVPTFQPLFPIGPPANTGRDFGPETALALPANCAKLNRQTLEVERHVTSRKQITPTRSNRQKFNFCSNEIQPFARARLSPVGAQHAAPGTDTWLISSHRTPGCGDRVLLFLTGSDSQTEIAVTRSIQSTVSFLTGSRIARQGLRQRTDFSAMDAKRNELYAMEREQRTHQRHGVRFQSKLRRKHCTIIQ